MLDPVPEEAVRLVLLRHPEIDPAQSSRAIGGGPAELGNRGRHTVVRWLETLAVLDLERLYTADVPQCAGPTEALARKFGLPWEADARLRDQSMGEWEGRSWAELQAAEPVAVREFFEEFGVRAATGGESLGQAVERLLSWWTATAPGLRGACVGVVSAGNVLSGMAAALFGLRLTASLSLALAPGRYGVIDVHDEAAVLRTWQPDLVATT